MRVVVIYRLCKKTGYTGYGALCLPLTFPGEGGRAIG